MAVRVVTVAERPELVDVHHDIGDMVWPAHLSKGHHEGNPYWGRIFREAPELQVTLLDDASGEVLAAGNTIDLVLEEGELPETWQEVLRRGLDDRAVGRPCTILSALAATVHPAHQGKGLSTVLLEAMKSLAADRGYDAMIAPVRPTLKVRYPLTPIERYAAWTADDGAPFDPWLRVHHRMGAGIVGFAHGSPTVHGTLAEWETWTGMRFPESGSYVVPGALEVVEIDCEGDTGRTAEPNVWMRHPVSAR